jgi:CheY-like chemotaxis protein
MGGTLKYDGGYGDGAAFVFRIVLPKAAPVEQPKEVTPKSTKKVSRRLNILVAEDNAINRKVLKAILGKMPFDLNFAHDGQEAVCMAEAEPFDVILMDIQMPIMGGIEATKTIQSGTSANATTPVIAITANAMAGDKESYLAAGMCEFVSKPINPKDLIMAIIAATKGAGAPAEQTQKRA